MGYPRRLVRGAPALHRVRPHGFQAHIHDRQGVSTNIFFPYTDQLLINFSSFLASSTDERHHSALPCSPLDVDPPFIPPSPPSSSSSCAGDVLDAVTRFSLPSERLPPLRLRVRTCSELLAPAPLLQPLALRASFVRRFAVPSSFASALPPSPSLALSLYSSFPSPHACLSYTTQSWLVEGLCTCTA